MAKLLNRKRNTAPRRVLRLPDLDLAKRTVLNSFGSPDSRLGQSDSGRMDPRRSHRGREAVPMCESFRRDLGRRDHGKGGLAYREGLGKASRHPATGAS
jgi:hypothetical protein